jgi:hypothetical protein
LEQEKANEGAKQFHDELLRLHHEFHAKYPFAEAVFRIIYEHDPLDMGIEYMFEACEIVGRLQDARSAEDLRGIVHQAFTQFNPEDAGPEMRYDALAAEIWAVWHKHQAEPN